jgi:hypothetical protein
MPPEPITATKDVFRHGDLGIRFLLDAECSADLIDDILIWCCDAAADGLLAGGIRALPVSVNVASG